MKAIIFYVLISFFTPVLATVTGIPLQVEGENPFVTRMPNPDTAGSWEDIANISYSAEGMRLPYLSNESGTGVVIEKITPFGYIKQVGGLWFSLLTFNISTGESFTDAMLYAFFWFPLGILLIHSFIKAVL